MTPEGKLKAEVKEYLSSLGPPCWWFMPSANGYGKRGVPDFVGCYKGQFFAIETKSALGKETPWQERCRREIQSSEGWSIVAYNIEDVYALFRKIQSLYL